MLFIVLGLVACWLLISLVCIGLCVSAARGDRGLSAPVVQLSSARRRRRFARPVI